MDARGQKIIETLEKTSACSSSVLMEAARMDISYATFKRILSKLVDDNYVDALGQGRGTKYEISDGYRLLRTFDMATYFEKEIDERVIAEGFNFSLLRDVLAKQNLFSATEISKLNGLHALYQENIANLTKGEYRNELERLAVDLSWKSSQIEGNTYSLLETEKLLKESVTASGKTKDEATMLLNHKEAIDFIIEKPDYLTPLSVVKIEDLHSLLIKDLDVVRNLRTKRVGISGTNYRPLDNQFQIAEALQSACDIINAKSNVFERALLVLVLISYIQPFMDGNKRTARIVSNAVLMQAGYCPLSFRTVDSMEYKKAMLLFYEQNNLSQVKLMFMEQFEFAVKTYF